MTHPPLPSLFRTLPGLVNPMTEAERFRPNQGRDPAVDYGQSKAMAKASQTR